jgi:hypothetical protein
VWFHGHAISDDAIRVVSGTTIVPLHGVPFEPRSNRPHDPGRNAWCVARLNEGDIRVERLGPVPGERRHGFWHELKRSGWIPIRDRPGEVADRLVAPHLAPWLSRPEPQPG